MTLPNFIPLVPGVLGEFPEPHLHVPGAAHHMCTLLVEGRLSEVQRLSIMHCTGKSKQQVKLFSLHLRIVPFFTFFCMQIGDNTIETILFYYISKK